MALERRTQRSQPRAGDGTARRSRSKARDRGAALLMATATDRARGRRREEARIGFTRENRTEQSTRTEQGIGMPRAPALCSARAAGAALVSGRGAGGKAELVPASASRNWE